MLMVLISMVSALLMIFFLMQCLLGAISFSSDRQFSMIESGFEALKCSSYMSSSFFILAVLFVLFDMELIFLLPILISVMQYNIVFLMIWIFLGAFICLTLLWEWWYHGLKWSS